MEMKYLRKPIGVTRKDYEATHSTKTGRKNDKMYKEHKNTSKKEQKNATGNIGQISLRNTAQERTTAQRIHNYWDKRWEKFVYYET